jgi:hypothetical protein
MSDGAHRHHAPRRRLERVTTRDAVVPVSDDDRDMAHSWRCIEVPPTNDADWFILDSSSDRKTVWARWV